MRVTMEMWIVSVRLVHKMRRFVLYDFIYQLGNTSSLEKEQKQCGEYRRSGKEGVESMLREAKCVLCPKAIDLKGPVSLCLFQQGSDFWM